MQKLSLNAVLCYGCEIKSSKCNKIKNAKVSLMDLTKPDSTALIFITYMKNKGTVLPILFMLL